MLERFAGTVEGFATVAVAELVAWITAIDFADWPQQHRLADGGIRPMMVSDHAWHGFGARTRPLIEELLAYFPGCVSSTELLSVVMPGHGIEPHTDSQPPHWRCRVHVPLTSNDRSEFWVGGRAWRLVPGEAYRVNTEAWHGVINDGPTPRIHLMFDVHQVARS